MEELPEFANPARKIAAKFARESRSSERRTPSNSVVGEGVIGFSRVPGAPFMVVVTGVAEAAGLDPGGCETTCTLSSAHLTTARFVSGTRTTGGAKLAHSHRPVAIF